MLIAFVTTAVAEISVSAQEQQQNQTRREKVIQFLKSRRQAQGGAGQTSGGLMGGGGRFGGQGMGLGPELQGAGMRRNSAADNEGLLDEESSTEARKHGNSNATARDIAYGPDRLQKLDVYAPPKGSAPGPVILFVHGGGWMIGDKKQHGQKGAVYSSRGILFISANYRLAPRVMHPKEIEDVASAFAWVKAHAKEYGGDPNRIYVMGHSAGAHLVDLLSTNDKYLIEKGLNLSDVKGCISLDTASLNLTNRASLPGAASKRVSYMVKTAFGTDPKVLTDASPLLQLCKGKHYPPFLMFYSGRRKDSIAAHKTFQAAVSDVGGTMIAKGVPLNHMEINQAAGDQTAEVFVQCLSFVEGK